MSRHAVAEFLRRVAVDKQLREDLVRLAGRHGLHFTAEELASVDLQSVYRGMSDAESTLRAALNGLEDDSSDPGFGIIEVPG